MPLFGGVIGWTPDVRSPEICENIRTRLAFFDERLPAVIASGSAAMIGGFGPSSDHLVGHHSDMATLPHGLTCNTPDAVDRFPGSFAVAIADAGRRRLFLSRDVAGGHPLFVYETPHLVAFASMPGALVDLTGGAIDLSYFADGLRGHGGGPERNHWSGIRRVRPGTLEIHDPQGRSTRSLTLRYPAGTDNPEATLVQLLDDSTRREMAGCEAVAVQLSSGLDSNAVLASAIRPAERPRLFAITAAPNPALTPLINRHRYADESPLAARAAAAAGVPHVVFRDDSRIIPSLWGASRHYQGPVPNPLNHGWMVGLGQLARDHGATRMLSAIHGNSTLSFGGIHVLPEWLRRGQPLEWLRQIAAARKIPGVRLRGLLLNSVEPWIPSSLLDRLYEIGQGAPVYRDASFVRPEWHRKTSRDPALDIVAIRRDMMLNYDQGLNSVALQSISGTEWRDPTGDRALLEFALSLPPEAFLDRGAAKPLFKRAMAGRIPAYILHEPRRGLQGADFFGRINQTEAHEAFEEIATCHDTEELLDLPRMRRAIEDWPAFDPTRFGALFSFVRHLTDALAVGVFLKEKDGNTGAP
jgi:asparagine synthase (glutamine-hydrolysing)